MPIINKKVDKLIHSIGLLNNLSDSEIKLIVESQFKFAYDKIRELSFEDLTKEEIDEMKTNFYWKYIGKLYTTGEIVERQRKRDKIVYDKFIKKNEERNQ